ncbi:MAG: hypothetical protein KAI14_00065 [Dehalococcoidales bacterium]|nr:hypothetical protein [Dehalococcoidales bacterium]
MGIRYSNGFGLIYDKELEKLIAKVNCSLVETDATKYARKRWWGEFSTIKAIERTGKYVIEMEDGRRGECIAFAGSNAQQGPGSQYYYHFNGRSALRR